MIHFLKVQMVILKEAEEDSASLAEARSGWLVLCCNHWKHQSHCEFLRGHLTFSGLCPAGHNKKCFQQLFELLWPKAFSCKMTWYQETIKSLVQHFTHHTGLCYSSSRSQQKHKNWGKPKSDRDRDRVPFSAYHSNSKQWWTEDTSN